MVGRGWRRQVLPRTAAQRAHNYQSVRACWHPPSRDPDGDYWEMTGDVDPYID